MSSICGYADWFHYDKSWWRRWCWLTPGHPGSHFDDAHEPTEEEMFAALRAEHEQAAAPVDEDADVDAVTVTQPAQEVDPLGIRRAGPKKVIVAAVAAGFTVRAAESASITKGKQYKTGANAGQFRADKEQTHLYVTGVLQGLAAFSVSYLNGGLFQDAHVWDVAGWPTELRFDYTPTSEKKKEVGEQRAMERAADLDRRYNDGAEFVNRGKRLVTTVGDLHEWMADVMPDFEAPKRKTAPPPVDPDLALSAPMESGSWSAA